MGPAWYCYTGSSPRTRPTHLGVIWNALLKAYLGFRVCGLGPGFRVSEFASSPAREMAGIFVIADC